MKKRYVKPVIILSLVGVLGIAGALAYLTDTTGTITNSFEVDQKVGIVLEETYTDFVLVPGETVDKDPTITVVADDSYVFTEVVEKIPTVALANGSYEFSDYVIYSINGGGTVYLSSTDDTYIAETWKWTQVGTATTVVGDDGYTTVTYVYALTDNSSNLLSISSLDKADGSGANDAEFPILTDDKVTIPKDLTQAMLKLLLTGSGDDTYSVDLAFTGYAIQTANITVSDDLSIADVYNLAKDVTE